MKRLALLLLLTGLLLPAAPAAAAREGAPDEPAVKDAPAAPESARPAEEQPAPDESAPAEEQPAPDESAPRESTPGEEQGAPDESAPDENGPGGPENAPGEPAGREAEPSEGPEGAPAPAEGEEAEAAAPAEGEPGREMYESFERLVRVMEIVESRYVEPVEREQLYEGSIRGMLDSLDRFSSYIPPERYTSFLEETEQEFSGIGVTITLEGDRVKVVSTLEGMPAFESGVQPGDYIVVIDGTPVEELEGLPEVASMLKGPTGSEVEVTLLRPSTKKRFTVTLTRRDIPISTVRGYRSNAATGSWDFWVDRELGIGYIRLTKFARNTADELDEAYRSLDSEELTGLVLDLRYNGGGLLEAAVTVADRFVDEGVVVRTKGRAGVHSEHYARPYDTYDDPVPLVILVNRYSASASEVLAGALQDYRLAVLVGERTYGKGSVQNVIRLNGHGAIRLTVAYYYTPKGRLVHRRPGSKEWGLEPDVVDKMDVGEQIALREEWARVAGGGEPKSLGEGGGEVIDTQLARALDILRGGILFEKATAGEGEE